MTKHTWWFVILGLALIGSASAWGDAPSTKLRADSNMVCGPRCVQFILESYGQEVGLVDLVKEIQWPDLEAGAALDRIERSLNARGIQTRAIRVAPGRRLDWSHPALLFTDEGDPPRGHYVVAAPGTQTDSDSLIWAGIEGWRRGRWDEVTRGFSGVALLTSPDPGNGQGRRPCPAGKGAPNRRSGVLGGDSRPHRGSRHGAMVVLVAPWGECFVPVGRTESGSKEDWS